MINLKKKNKEILLKDIGAFNSLWNLMEESFPFNERKTCESYREQLFDPLFEIDLFYSGVEIAGFIGWWHVDDFRFVEHFAVSLAIRGRGVGSMVFSQFLYSAPSPVILEVEPPDTNDSSRRITFYRRLGFDVLPYDYYQPSYHQDGEPVKMIIMTNGEHLMEHDFIKIKNAIYTTVYKI